MQASSSGLSGAEGNASTQHQHNSSEFLQRTLDLMRETKRGGAVQLTTRMRDAVELLES
jgi:hypothetical protein